MQITFARDDGTVLDLISIPFDGEEDEIRACNKIVSDIEMIYETEEVDTPFASD